MAAHREEGLIAQREVLRHLADNGEGHFGILSTDGPLRAVGPGWRQTGSVEVPILDCPC